MARLPRDENRIPVIGAISSADSESLVILEADPVNKSLHVHITGDDVGIGGGTQYTEDAAAAANPVGSATILIRTDTPATQVTTDGDNVAQRGTNYGAAYVQLVTSSGSYIDSVGGGTEYTEDVATANPIVGKAIMVERDDALTTVTPVEGDNIGLRGTAEGALWTQDFNSDAMVTDLAAIEVLLTTPATNQLPDNHNVNVDNASIAVTGTFFQATQPVSIAQDVMLGTDFSDVLGTASLILATQADDVANTSDGLQTSSFLYVFDGTTWDRLRGDSTNGVLVNLGSNNDVVVTATDLDIRPLVNTDVVTVELSAVDNAVLDNIDADLTTIIGHVDGIETLIGTTNTNTAATTTALQIMDDWDNGASDGASVSGDVAHDGVDAGEPVKIGAVAIAHGTNPTAVAAADRTNLYANRAGVQFVIGGHPNVVTKSFNVADADGAQTDADILGAVGSGTKVVVTMIQVYTDSATTAATQVRVGFGTANTPALDAAGVVLSHGGIAPGSGLVIGNGSGIIGIGGDGAELRVTCEDPAGGSMDIIVTYYTIES